MNPLLERLRYHVTGAIERGEAEAITEVKPMMFKPDNDYGIDGNTLNALMRIASRLNDGIAMGYEERCDHGKRMHALLESRAVDLGKNSDHDSSARDVLGEVAMLIHSGAMNQFKGEPWVQRVLDLMEGKPPCARS